MSERNVIDFMLDNCNSYLWIKDSGYLSIIKYYSSITTLGSENNLLLEKSCKQFFIVFIVKLAFLLICLKQQCFLQALWILSNLW